MRARVPLHAVPLLTNVQELEFPLDHGEAVTDIPVPDQQLLDMFLDCVHPKLRAVIQTHYRFEVFRGNVTKMDPTLQRRAVFTLEQLHSRQCRRHHNHNAR
jgi:hypothetical protein